MNRTRRYERLGTRYFVYLIPLVIASVVIIGAVLIVRKSSRPVYAHVSVILASDPMILVTWERDTDRLLIIKIPSDVTIDALHGYGRYSLLALWMLGGIEKVGGDVLAQSLGDTFGVPVAWYMGEPGRLMEDGSHETRLTHAAFSFRNIPRIVAGSYETNIPIFEYVRLAWAVGSMSPDRIRVLDLFRTTVVAPVQLPDGTTTSFIDKERLDALIGNAFEDARIRKEAITVSVRNTTTMATLGQRVARLLNHIGVLVVSVDNERPEVDRCVLRGSDEMLKRTTAVIIRDLYDCTIELAGEEERSDLTILIGSSYQSRFAPVPKGE